MDQYLKFLATGAVVILIAAAIGVFLRRRKLYREEAKKVAEELMAATTELRDAVQQARTPIVDSSEYPAGWPGPDTAPADENAAALEYVYGNRLEPVSAALGKFEAAAQRGEMIRGGGVRAAADKMVLCAKTLRAAVDWLVTNEASGGQHFKRDRALGKKARDIVSADPEDEPNKLNEEIREAESSIRKALRRHLS